jgi:hypothetical protein
MLHKLRFCGHFTSFRLNLYLIILKSVSNLSIINPSCNSMCCVVLRPVLKFAKYDYWLLMSVRLSFVRLSALNNSAATERIFMEIDIWVFFVNLSIKFKFY